MKNERETEIERVNRLNKHSGGPFKQRQKTANHEPTTKQIHFNLRAPRKIKKQGEMPISNGKESETKEKKWNCKN